MNKKVKVLLIIICLGILGNIIGEILKNSRETQQPQKEENVSQQKKKDIDIIKEIDKRIAEYQQHIKKYYPTDEMLNQLNTDIVHLVAGAVGYKDFKNDEQKTIYLKSKELLPKAVILRRLVFARLLEKKYLEEGYDVEIIVEGKNKDILKFKYVLMSRPLIHKITNETGFLETAKKLEFKKVVFTDGFNHSWTYNL